MHILVHNFSPFDIQHTKSPKKSPRTHALDHMSKLWMLQSLTTTSNKPCRGRAIGLDVHHLVISRHVAFIPFAGARLVLGNRVLALRFKTHSFFYCRATPHPARHNRTTYTRSSAPKRTGEPRGSSTETTRRPTDAAHRTPMLLPWQRTVAITRYTYIPRS